MSIPVPQLSRRRTIERALVGAAVGFVLWFFYWTVESNRGFDDRDYAEYYRLLVDGFRAGHTYLPYDAGPTMALENPYDPAQNTQVRLPDGSYYRGHYYLYFGATPAVALILPAQLLTGRYLTMGVAVYVFCCTGFLTLAWLWLRIRRDYFPNSSVFAAPLGVLVLGLCTHTLSLARRAMFWELPISGGHAFAVLTLAFVYLGCRSRRPGWYFGWAGLCLGLAASSRPPYLLTISLFLPVLWLAWKRGLTWRGWLAWLGPAAAAFLAVMVGVMSYNYARFDDPFQFGQAYQLTGVIEGKMRHFHWSYFVHNLEVYYCALPRWNWEFPFIVAPGPHNSPLGYYAGEPVAGLGVTFTVIWALLAVPRLLWRGRKERQFELVAFICSAGFIGVTMAVILGSFFSATARYQSDFTPFLMLLAACGGLELERWARGAAWRRVAVNGFFAVGGVASVIVGILLSVEYHREVWRDYPDRWASLQAFWQPVVAKARAQFGVSMGRTSIRVRLPTKSENEIEVLWSGQARGRVDHVLLRRESTTSWRIGYEASDAVVRWSEPFVAGDAEHLIEVQVPSLQEPPNRTMSPPTVRAALKANAVAVIWLDGKRVISEILLPSNRRPTQLVEAPQFSGEIVRTRNKLPRPDAVPELEERGWRFAGLSEVAANTTVPLATWGAGSETEGFYYRRGANDTARLVFHGRLGNEVASPDFAAPLNGVPLEVVHLPLWPWSASNGEDQPFTFYLGNKKVWEHRPRLFGASAENVRVVDARAYASKAAPDPSIISSIAGGVFRIRFMGLWGTFRHAQPLLVLGREGAGELLMLSDEGEPKILVDHWGRPLMRSQRFALDDGAVTTVEFKLPSFDPAEFGGGKSGPMIIRVNGRVVLNTVQDCYGFNVDQIYVGRNVFPNTGCDTEFGGWIIEARWIAE